MDKKLYDPDSHYDGDQIRCDISVIVDKYFKLESDKWIRLENETGTIGHKLTTDEIEGLKNTLSKEIEDSRDDVKRQYIGLSGIGYVHCTPSPYLSNIGETVIRIYNDYYGKIGAEWMPNDEGYLRIGRSRYYKILEYGDSQTLSEKVDSYLCDGWKLFGLPILVKRSKHVSANCVGWENYYMQTVIKDDSYCGVVATTTKEKM